jgi:hypothetical protein
MPASTHCVSAPRLRPLTARRRNARPGRPAAVLDGELLALCHELEYLAPDDRPVARLWAIFASPKRKDTAIRTTFSVHALPGIRCRGFEMRVGTARDGGRIMH